MYLSNILNYYYKYLRSFSVRKQKANLKRTNLLDIHQVFNLNTNRIIKTVCDVRGSYVM